MTSHVVAYLIGTLLGELALAAWWMQGQPAGTAWSAYVRAKKGEAMLSAVVAAAACLVWAEGTLLKYLGWELEFTLGVSVVAGSAVAFFAHGIVGLFRKRIGVEEEKP